MIPTMNPVESSNIKARGYDDSTNELHVEFKSGGHYAYPGVPRDLYDEWLAAESVGSFFHGKIKGNFDSQKIEKKEEQEHDNTDTTSSNQE